MSNNKAIKKNACRIHIAPATRSAMRRALAAWYAANRRLLPWRSSSDPYTIWISEVMLQQTQVKTATPYYHRFIRRFPDLSSLAGADLQTVLKYWEGLGYYSRARNLHKAAILMAGRMEGRFPDTWDAARELPGVGDYIASAVLSIAFDQAYAVVDGNVKRVLGRLFRLEWPVNQPSAHRSFQEIADQLLDRRAPGDHNQAMMELGALVCTPKDPHCQRCPLAAYCQAFEFNVVADFPRRTRRAPLPVRCVALGVVNKRGRILMIQRAEGGMLGGLWEFPGGAAGAGDDPRTVCRSKINAQVNLKVAVEELLATVAHTYTHFKLHMEVFKCRWKAGRVRLHGPEGFKWVSPSRIYDLPLHGAIHKALAQIERHQL
jgi:A/G-specific adenine glycosylase